MRLPLILFLVGLGVFAAFSNSRLKIHSKDNHFVYLADAFLQGSTELKRTPPHQNDWANYEVLKLNGASADKFGDSVSGFFTRRGGKPNQFRTLKGELIDLPRKDRGASEKRYFVSFPPAPAVLMMPMVAAVGYGTNDVLFTVLFAAFNVALIFLVLRRLTVGGHGDRSEKENLWLTALFAFGSAHMWCAVLGQVWFTALIVGVTFHLAFIYFAIDARRPLLAGICLAFAFSTRATLVFAALFFYLQLFFPNDGKPLADKWKRFALFSAPCLVVGVTLLVYNYVRFEDPMEFGHTYLAGGTIPRIRDFGLFHHRFISRNLTAAFTLLPRVVDQAPYVQLSKHGMSIFLSMPAVVWLLWPKRKSSLGRAMGITALVLAVPLLLYQNTGQEQYSYRFILDLLPYLVCGLALWAHPFTRWLKGAIIVGIIVNAIGAMTFQRVGKYKVFQDYMTEEPRR